MSAQSYIPGKDSSLEATIDIMQTRLQNMGFFIEEKSWLNPVDGIWSVHVRDRDCPILFTNGKGATRLACLASALGEFFERLATNYFWTHFYLGPDVTDLFLEQTAGDDRYVRDGETEPMQVRTETIEDHPEKRFHGEIDRIYTSVPGSLLLRDGTRQLTLERSGFEDVVVTVTASPAVTVRSATDGPPVFPPPQVLPVRGQGCPQDRLQGRAPAAGLHVRAWQDRAFAHHRRFGEEAA